MELDDSTKRAMCAYAQWQLGDKEWAAAFIRIVESDDPTEEAEMEMDGETVDEVLSP